MGARHLREQAELEEASASARRQRGVAMQRSPNPWEIFDQLPPGRSALPAAVTAMVAAIAGFLTRQSRQPAPPGLPTLGRFQRDQWIPALEWLARRTDWP